MTDPFIGEIRIFAGNFAPRDWAFCNGASISIAQNTALFAILGTTYGGDGRTSFQLPDLQGRAPMHPGSSPPGLSTTRLGQRGGAETVTVTTSNMPSHTHQLIASTDRLDEVAATNNPSGQLTGRMQANQSIYAADTGAIVSMASESVQSAGGDQSHNNMQPFLAVNFIIALTGIQEGVQEVWKRGRQPRGNLSMERLLESTSAIAKTSCKNGCLLS